MPAVGVLLCLRCMCEGRSVSQRSPERFKLPMVRLRERDREQSVTDSECAVLGESSLGCTLEAV